MVDLPFRDVPLLGSPKQSDSVIDGNDGSAALAQTLEAKARREEQERRRRERDAFRIAKAQEDAEEDQRRGGLSKSEYAQSVQARLDRGIQAVLLNQEGVTPSAFARLDRSSRQRLARKALQRILVASPSYRQKIANDPAAKARFDAQFINPLLRRMSGNGFLEADFGEDSEIEALRQQGQANRDRRAQIRAARERGEADPVLALAGDNRSSEDGNADPGFFEGVASIATGLGNSALQGIAGLGDSIADGVADLRGSFLAATSGEGQELLENELELLGGVSAKYGEAATATANAYFRAGKSTADLPDGTDPNVRKALGSIIGLGVGEIVGRQRSLVVENKDNAVTSTVKDVDEHIRSLGQAIRELTPNAARNDQELGGALDRGDYWGALNEALDDPGGVLGSTVGFVVGPSKFTGGVLRGIGRAAEMANATRIGGVARAAGQSSNVRLGSVVVAQSGDTTTQARDLWESMSIEQKRGSQLYARAQEALGDDATEDDIIALAGDTGATLARNVSLGAGALGMVLGPGVERALSGPNSILTRIVSGQSTRYAVQGTGAAKKVVARSVALGAGREATSEFVEEGGQALAVELGTQGEVTDGSVGGIVAQGAFGATLGGILGGSLSGLTARAAIRGQGINEDSGVDAPSGDTPSPIGPILDAAQEEINLAQAAKGEGASRRADLLASTGIEGATNTGAFEALAERLNEEAELADQIVLDLAQRSSTDPEVAAFIENAPEYRDALLEHETRLQAFTAMVRDGLAGRFNDVAHRLSGEVKLETARESGDAGDTQELTAEEVGAVTTANEVETVMSNNEAILEGATPEDQLRTAHEALNSAINPLEVPYRASVEETERVGLLASQLQTRGESSASAFEAAQAIISTGATNSVRDNKRLLDLADTNPEYAPAIERALELRADRQRLTAQRKVVRNLRNDIENAENGVDIDAAQARQESLDALNAVVEAGGRPTLRRGRPNPRALTAVDLTRDTGQPLQGDVRGAESVSLERGTGQDVDAIREAGKAENPGTSNVLRRKGMVNGLTARNRQQAGFRLDDLKALLDAEQIVTQGEERPRDFLHNLGAAAYDTIMRARNKASQDRAREIENMLQPLADLGNEVALDAQNANPDMTEQDVRNAMALLPYLRHAAERIEHKFKYGPDRRELLTEEAKLKADTLVGKIRGGEDAAQANAELNALMRDVNSYLEPADDDGYLASADVETIRIDVTTESIAQKKMTLAVNLAEAAAMEQELLGVLGPKAAEYADAIVAVHRRAYELRLAVGNVDQIMQWVFEGHAWTKYLPMKRVAEQTDIDTDEVNFINRRFRRSDPPNLQDVPLRDPLIVAEDALTAAVYDHHKEVVLASVAELGRQLTARGATSLIEVKPARPPVFVPEKGHYVYPDQPGVDETNRYIHRRADGQNMIITIKDEALSRSVSRMFGSNKDSLQDKEGAIGLAARATSGATRLVTRGMLASSNYLSSTIFPRDQVENLIQAFSANGVKTNKITQQALTGTAARIASSPATWKFLRANAGTRDGMLDNMKEKGGVQQALAELYEQGVIFSFDAELGAGRRQRARGIRDAALAGRPKGLVERGHDTLDILGNKATPALKLLDDVMVMSDVNGRLLAYMAAKDSGASTKEAAGVARDTLNFAQRVDEGEGLASGPARVAPIVFPFFNTGLVGMSKLNRQIFENGRAPLVSETLPDGSVQQRVDFTRAIAEFNVRPLLVSGAMTALTAYNMVAALDGIGGDDEPDELGRTGISKFRAKDLMSAIGLHGSYDEDTDSFNVTGAPGAYGIYPLMAGAIMGGILMSEGTHSENEVLGAMYEMTLRNISPIGEGGTQQLGEGRGLEWNEWRRNALVSLTPILGKGLAEVSVNRDRFGRPVYGESRDTRDNLLAAANPDDGGRQINTPEIYHQLLGEGAEWKMHLVESIVGGPLRDADSVLRAAQKYAEDPTLESGTDKFIDLVTPGRTVATTEYNEGFEFGQLVGSAYAPVGRAIRAAKREDKTAGKPFEVGPVESSYIESNPQRYAAYKMMGAYFGSDGDLKDEIIALRGADDAGSEANLAKRQALQSERQIARTRMMEEFQSQFPEIYRAALGF